MNNLLENQNLYLYTYREYEIRTTTFFMIPDYYFFRSNHLNITLCQLCTVKTELCQERYMECFVLWLLHTGMIMLLNVA